jgi:hypothetical protein
MVAHCLGTFEHVWKVTRWEAEYVPTKKNAQTADFWLTCGFDESSGQGGHKTYRRGAGIAFPAFPSHVALLGD